jgi:L-ribulose-5-phosphate 4-epimerase
VLEDLKDAVLAANLALAAAGLVTLTWGNVSGRDPGSGLMVIKPSGVPYAQMTVSDMVVVGPDGTVVEGGRRPSTDTPTHLVLYRELPGIGGVVHTHSTWATAWAQAHRPVPLLGTTHADMSPAPVPLTEPISVEQAGEHYEEATGDLIVAAVAGRPATEVPAVLVDGHGPFCWAGTAPAAVEVAVTLETVAKMALLTTVLEPEGGPLSAHVVQRHYLRKHGPGAYYGQTATTPLR